MNNNHLDPREIEADIEKTRKNISENLEEIHDRLSPNRFLDHTIGYISDNMLENNNHFKSLAETVKKNPAATALIGFGLGWLIISNRNNKLHANALSKHGDNSSSGTTDDQLENTTDSTPDIPGRKKDLVEDNTKEKNSQQGSDQDEHAHELNKLHEQPLVLIGAGLTLGAALGIYLTSSQRDNKTLKKNLERKIDQAVETGDEQLEKVKEAVVSAVETINEAVGEVSNTSGTCENKNKKTS